MVVDLVATVVVGTTENAEYAEYAEEMRDNALEVMAVGYTTS